MARPRAFDTDEVLDRAAEAFRAGGFEGTSLERLEKATGLRRASLYGAFGDKASLYAAALRRYDAGRGGGLVARLEAAPTGRQALERLMRSVLEESFADPRGCLMANAASENGGRDAAVSRCLSDNRRRLEGALHAQILRGRADRSLKARGDARVAARALLATVLGLRSLAKSGCTKEELRAVAEAALAAAG